MSIISRLTTWTIGQVLKAADLNGEFNNVTNLLNNLDAATTTWTNVKAATLTSTTTTSLKGTTTNDSAAAGIVGEILSSVVANQSPGGTTVYYDITSLALTAGDWDVTAFATGSANGGTWSLFLIGISTTSGNSIAGTTEGDSRTQASWANSATTPLTWALSVPAFRVSITSTTTYYFKGRFDYSAGTPVASGARLSARRIR